MPVSTRACITTLWLGVVWMLAPACGDSSGSIDRACDSDRACARGVCRAHPEAEAVDGEPLSLACGEIADGAIDLPCCQSADDCARGICLVSGACAVPCVDASDCALDQRCSEVHARASDAALQRLSACVSRVERVEGVEVSEMELAGVLTTEPDGVDVQLSPVEGTALFVLEHASETRWPMTVECRPPLCVRSLSTADDQPVVLFDAATLQPGNAAPLNTVSQSVDSMVSTIMLPNGPRAVLSAAGYRVQVRSESAGDLRVTRLQRTVSGSVLDLHLHYVGADGMRPEGTRGPALIADALAHTETLLGQAGLALGDVCQTEVVGALRDRLSVIDPPRFGLLVELPELFALSAGARGTAVHVFLVDQADLALGISGGLPGPAGLHGTGSSGVVMSVALFDDAEQLGRALAHELGHYLGLFHPREADDVTLDPLGDTPNDASNLMFRAASGGELLTPTQRDVLRRSLVLR